MNEVVQFQVNFEYEMYNPVHGRTYDDLRERSKEVYTAKRGEINAYLTDRLCLAGGVSDRPAGMLTMRWCGRLMALARALEERDAQGQHIIQKSMGRAKLLKRARTAQDAIRPRRHDGLHDNGRWASSMVGEGKIRHSCLNNLRINANV